MEYKFIEPEETRQELVNILVKGLNRSLTQQEADTIYWLSDCGIESRVTITKLFKELVDKIN